MISGKNFQKGCTKLVLNGKTNDDLSVISALVQDAVLLKKNIRWIKARHRFTLLLNRFQWELIEEKIDESVTFGRSKSALIFDGVIKVFSLGIEKTLQDGVLSLLSLDFKSDKDTKEIELIFSGGCAIKLHVEYLHVMLKDLEMSNSKGKTMIPKHDI